MSAVSEELDGGNDGKVQKLAGAPTCDAEVSTLSAESRPDRGAKAAVSTINTSESPRAADPYSEVLTDGRNRIMNEEGDGESGKSSGLDSIKVPGKGMKSFLKVPSTGPYKASPALEHLETLNIRGEHEPEKSPLAANPGYSKGKVDKAVVSSKITMERAKSEKKRRPPPPPPLTPSPTSEEYASHRTEPIMRNNNAAPSSPVHLVSPKKAAIVPTSKRRESRRGSTESSKSSTLGGKPPKTRRETKLDRVEVSVSRDGSCYVGEFNKGGKRHGSGVFRSSTRRYLYRGDWRQDAQQGYGDCYYEDTKTRFEGVFQSGVSKGAGRMIWNNGDCFVGEFDSDGQPCGLGLFQCADGQTFCGDFKQGLCHGYGKYFDDKGESYVGCFSKGRRHGLGVLYREETRLAGAHLHTGGSSEEAGLWHQGQLVRPVEMNKQLANVLYEGETIVINAMEFCENVQEEVIQRVREAKRAAAKVCAAARHTLGLDFDQQLLSLGAGTSGIGFSGLDTSFEKVADNKDDINETMSMTTATWEDEESDASESGETELDSSEGEQSDAQDSNRTSICSDEKKARAASSTALKPGLQQTRPASKPSDPVTEELLRTMQSTLYARRKEGSYLPLHANGLPEKDKGSSKDPVGDSTPKVVATNGSESSAFLALGGSFPSPLASGSSAGGTPQHSIRDFISAKFGEQIDSPRRHSADGHNIKAANGRNNRAAQRSLFSRGGNAYGNDSDEEVEAPMLNAKQYALLWKSLHPNASLAEDELKTAFRKSDAIRRTSSFKNTTHPHVKRAQLAAASPKSSSSLLSARQSGSEMAQGKSIDANNGQPNYVRARNRPSSENKMPPLPILASSSKTDDGFSDASSFVSMDMRPPSHAPPPSVHSEQSSHSSVPQDIAPPKYPPPPVDPAEVASEASDWTTAPAPPSHPPPPNSKQAKKSIKSSPFTIGPTYEYPNIARYKSNRSASISTFSSADSSASPKPPLHDPPLLLEEDATLLARTREEEALPSHGHQSTAPEHRHDTVVGSNGKDAQCVNGKATLEAGSGGGTDVNLGTRGGTTHVSTVTPPFPPLRPPYPPRRPPLPPKGQPIAPPS